MIDVATSASEYCIPGRGVPMSVDTIGHVQYSVKEDIQDRPLAGVMVTVSSLDDSLREETRRVEREHEMLCNPVHCNAGNEPKSRRMSEDEENEHC